MANSTVYGGVAGEVMGKDIASMSALRDPDETVLEAEIARALHPLSKPADHIQSLRNTLQEVMWDDVGVVRTETGMKRGLEKLAELDGQLGETGVDGSNLVFNLTWHDWLNMRSLLDISEVITRAGLERENSRGAHYREDFTDQGDLETSTFTVAQKTGDDVVMTQEKVEFSIVQPGETILPDSEPETLVAAV